MSIEVLLTRLCDAVEANTAALGADAPKAKGRKAATDSAPAQVASTATTAQATAAVSQGATVSQPAQVVATQAATVASAATAQTSAADPRSNPGYKETAELLTKAAEAKGRDPVVAILNELQSGCSSLLALNPQHYAAARAKYQALLAPTQPAPATAGASLV